MKKAFCTGTLAVSLLLGAARAADLFLNTDTATGFLLSGSVWTRYWLMAPVVILAWLAGLYVPRKQPCGLRPGAGVWMSGVNFVFVPLAFCSELYGFLTVLNVLFGTPEQAGRHQTAERILLGQLADVTRAALFVVFGVWCLLVFFENRAREKRGGWMLYLGVAGSAAFYLHTVVRFVEQPASLYRILPAVEIFTTQILPRFARISASSLRNIISLARSTACAHRFRAARNFGDISRHFCTPRRQRRCAHRTRISMRSWRAKTFTSSRRTKTRSLSSSIRKAKSVRSRVTTDFSSAAAAAPMKPGMQLCQFAK